MFGAGLRSGPSRRAALRRRMRVSRSVFGVILSLSIMMQLLAVIAAVRTRIIVQHLGGARAPGREPQPVDMCATER